MTKTQDSFLYSQDIAAEQVGGVLASILTNFADPNNDAIIMALEVSRAFHPLKYAKTPSIDWEKQEIGWLFYALGELKWRRLQNGNLRFVYLGEKDMCQKSGWYDGENDIKGLISCEKKRLIAWGFFDNEKKKWLEGRIGDAFSHPVSLPKKEEKEQSDATKKKKVVAFCLRTYHHQQSGRLRFWRHTGMKVIEANEG